MKFEFNGCESDSDQHYPFSVIPKVVDGHIPMRAGDTLKFGDIRFVAMKDGLYEFPPGRKNYLQIFPIENC